MAKPKRTAEWVKTALIVILTISALLLGWRTRLFNDFFATIPFFGSVANLMRGTAGETETAGASIKEAARPICIVITNETGKHYGVKYDTDARNTVYDRTSSILSEALGSAAEPAVVSEDEWRAALSGQGMFFEYMTPVKLSVLDGWLGARMPELSVDPSLRRVCVAFGEDRSRIYFEDQESGLFYGADTASSAGKAQELGIYGANGTAFAFETDIIGANNAPYMIIMPGSDHPDVRAGSAGDAESIRDIVLAALGHVDETFTTLPEADGALRCVGTQFNIRVEPQGRVLYRRTDGPPPIGERQSLSEGEMIERARVTVANTIGETCGNAEAFFESLEYGAGDTCSVTFGYYIAGGRLHLYDGRIAAKVTFAYGMITEVELNFRNFTLTGENYGLLPERQALAAAGEDFILCYSDAGAEILQPAWVIKADS